MSELVVLPHDGLCIHTATGVVPLLLASKTDCQTLLDSLRLGGRSYIQELSGILLKITAPSHHALNALVDEEPFRAEIQNFFPTDEMLGVLINSRDPRSIWIGNIEAIERASNNSPYCLYWTLTELRELLGGTP